MSETFLSPLSSLPVFSLLYLLSLKENAVDAAVGERREKKGGKREKRKSRAFFPLSLVSVLAFVPPRPRADRPGAMHTERRTSPIPLKSLPLEEKEGRTRLLAAALVLFAPSLFPAPFRPCYSRLLPPWLPPLRYSSLTEHKRAAKANRRFVLRPSLCTAVPFAVLFSSAPLSLRALLVCLVGRQRA